MVRHLVEATRLPIAKIEGWSAHTWNMKTWRKSPRWATRKEAAGNWQLTCAFECRSLWWTEKTKARQWQCQKWWAIEVVERKQSRLGFGLSIPVSTLDPFSLVLTTPSLSLSLSLSLENSTLPWKTYRGRPDWLVLVLGYILWVLPQLR